MIRADDYDALGKYIGPRPVRDVKPQADFQEKVDCSDWPAGVVLVSRIQEKVEQMRARGIIYTECFGANGHLFINGWRKDWTL